MGQRKQTEKEFAMQNKISIDTYVDSKKIRDLNFLDLSEINDIDNTNNNNIKLNSIERDIIIGSLYNQIRMNKNTLAIFQNINHLDYLYWKKKNLKRLSPKFKQIHTYNKLKGRTITDNFIYFSINSEIEILINEYMDKCNKITLPSLAIIIMDNGIFESDMLKIYLSENKIQYFAMYIYKHYNLRSIISNDYMIFKNDDLIKLKDMIFPFMFDKMKYKLGYSGLPECTVSKTVVFDSAHFLDEYDGKCCNLHGGRYELTVYIKDQINPDTGMVVDFTLLKKILKTYVIDQFDHHCLNYVVPQLAWRSTTELICIYIWQQLIQFFPKLYKIELKETPNSKCEYRGEGLTHYNKDLDLLNLYGKNRGI